MVYYKNTLSHFAVRIAGLSLRTEMAQAQRSAVVKIVALNNIRVFVKIFTGGNTISGSPVLLEGDCTVKVLKAKLLGDLPAACNRDDFVVAFNKNGVVLSDESSCKILKADDFLLICTINA